MQYIQGISRHQTYFSTLENQVSADNQVRLVDGFVDKLNLQMLGFTKKVHNSEGRFFPSRVSALALALRDTAAQAI